MRFQRRAGLTPDGVPGTQTRMALGRYGEHVLGSRPLTRGAAGWDVAALQFLLAWHGFPSATIDGGLGEHTERALRHFQRWAGLEPDGVAGATTYAALRRAPASVRSRSPGQSPRRSATPFGPRGNRFHAGIDILPHRDAGRSRRCRPRHVGGLAAGGWGNLVVVAHADGVRTMYAHLSSIARQARRLASAPATASGRSARRRRDRAASALRGPTPRRGRRSAPAPCRKTRL